MDLLHVKDVREKLRALDGDLHRVLLTEEAIAVPEVPARDVELKPAREHPPKSPLSTREGQARLLHDLASIELQAMELGLRTLNEFPHAPREFREQLAEITRGEGKHLQLCLDGLDHLGHRWGEWPAHVALWQATGTDDSLLDRILIVHRYLEGAGLDAGESILRKLVGVDSKIVRGAVDVIVKEEIDHVLFGSVWYRRVCGDERLDPERDFPERLEKLDGKIPRRFEPIAHEARRRAGFTDGEIAAVVAQRTRRSAPKN